MGRAIDGRSMAERLKRVLGERISAMETSPLLAGLVVGGGSADEVYIRMRENTARDIGASVQTVRMDAGSSTEDVLEALAALARDPEVHGIIVHQPLPGNVDGDRVNRAIPVVKDVEGMHPGNLGALLLGNEDMPPATPAAVVYMLEEERVPFRGAEAVIVSHSNVVGKPLALMFLNRDATVHVSHVHTRDLGAITSGADILVTAAGVPGLVRADMVKSGAAVIDVSMNRVDGTLCGDVVFDEVLEKASLVSPVPGGVGPVTNALLFRNLMTAYGSSRH